MKIQKCLISMMFVTALVLMVEYLLLPRDNYALVGISVWVKYVIMAPIAILAILFSWRALFSLGEIEWWKWSMVRCFDNSLVATAFLLAIGYISFKDLNSFDLGEFVVGAVSWCVLGVYCLFWIVCRQEEQTTCPTEEDVGATT